MNAPALAELARARRETELLWKAIADSVDESLLQVLREQDEESRVAAEAEFERQRRTALWEAVRESVDASTFAVIARNVSDDTSQQAALPVCVARRLFEAAECA